MGYHHWWSGVRTWKVLKPSAQAMRRKPTEAEAVLWEELRNRKIANAKFRRQHTIGRYLVDFCCPEAMLVIALDGSVHDLATAREKDSERQANLDAAGYPLLRFRNDAVLEDLPDVLAAIAAAISQSGR